MEETILLYVLVATTSLNTLLLLILVIGFVKLSLIANKLVNRVENFMDRGERELMTTVEIARRFLDQGSNFLGKASQAIERYLLVSNLSRIASSPKKPNIMTWIGIGYGVVQTLRRFLKGSN